jgi:hypothetical protein
MPPLGISVAPLFAKVSPLGKSVALLAATVSPHAAKNQLFAPKDGAASKTRFTPFQK